jgi:hypothetical protein
MEVKTRLVAPCSIFHLFPIYDLDHTTNLEPHDANGQQHSACLSTLLAMHRTKSTSYLACKISSVH